VALRKLAVSKLHRQVHRADEAWMNFEDRHSAFDIYLSRTMLIPHPRGHGNSPLFT
jgi:hypothetical protein